MKLLTFLSAAAVAFTVADAMSPATVEKIMPACALECMAISVKESYCLPTNQTCICTDPILQSTMQACVEERCTIKESLTTLNITSTACGAPIRNRTRVISISGVTGGAIALLAFLLRMMSRVPYFGGSQVGWDDLAMFVTMLFAIPLASLSVVLADLGLGKDIWTVPFPNITEMLHIYFFSEFLYVAILPLTKISILLFYLKIFPRRGFRIATYIVIGFNVAYLITFVVISVFQCTPIDGAWLGWDGTHHYTCRNENAQGWAAAGLNMILDIATMVLPLRELYKLNLSVRKKIGVMAMFSLGIFVTVVSAIRLHTLVEFANSKNITWDYVDVGYWSTIEVDVGIICACLPAIRSLLRGCCPAMFGDTRHGTTAKYSTSDPSVSRSIPDYSRFDDAWPKSKGLDNMDLPLMDLENSAANGWCQNMRPYITKTTQITQTKY